VRLLAVRPKLCALLAGVMAALALPPISLVPLIFVAFPGLYFLLAAAPGARAAAWRGFAFGMGYHLVGLFWITNAILIMAAEFWWAVPISVPLLAAVLSVFIALPCGLAVRFFPAGLPRILGLAGLWVLFDLGRQFFLTGFPWNELGTIAVMPGEVGLAMMQAASLATVHGLTWLVLLVSLLPVLGRRGMAASAAILVLWAGFGLARLRPAVSSGIDAVLVQGNVSQTAYLAHLGDIEWAREVFQRHLALTQEGARAGTAPFIVVWPEVASPWWLAQDEGARVMIMDAAKPALAAVIGAPREGEGGPRNSVFVLTPDAHVAAYYDKTHLVPYGEYFPSYLPIKLGPNGWVPGPGIRTLHVPGVPALGPLVCFEAIFPGQVADERDRPAMLLNLTDDAWFGDSTGPRQHLAQARLRAVEEGLPFLRAANTGISAVIDPYGRLTATLSLNKTGYLRAVIARSLPPTVVAEMGLWSALILAAISVCMGVFCRFLGKYPTTI